MFGGTENTSSITNVQDGGQASNDVRNGSCDGDNEAGEADRGGRNENVTIHNVNNAA